jgi:hypothetical protein
MGRKRIIIEDDNEREVIDFDDNDYDDSEDGDESAGDLLAEYLDWKVLKSD